MSTSHAPNAVAGNSAQPTTGLVNPIACPNCGMSDIATGAPEVLPRDYHTHSCRNCLLMFTPRASIGARYKALCAMVTHDLIALAGEINSGLSLTYGNGGRQSIIWGIIEQEYGQAAADAFVQVGWPLVPCATPDLKKKYKEAGEGGYLKGLSSLAPDHDAVGGAASEIVRALAGMTPYGEDGDGEDAMEVLNQLIGFARKAVAGAADDARAALYETSEDISSALLWLGDSNAPEHERIAGAISCLRAHQERRAAVNRETDAMRKS